MPPDLWEANGRHYPERGCHVVTGVETDPHKGRKPSRKAELFPLVEMGGCEFMPTRIHNKI